MSGRDYAFPEPPREAWCGADVLRVVTAALLAGIVIGIYVNVYWQQVAR
jgi:hypothetical protein